MRPRASHFPLGPQRLRAREVASTEARMLIVSTPMSTVTSSRRGRFRRVSTRSPLSRFFSLRRRRSNGVRTKREVSVAAKKAQSSARTPRAR